MGRTGPPRISSIRSGIDVTWCPAPPGSCGMSESSWAFGVGNWMVTGGGRKRGLEQGGSLKQAGTEQRAPGLDTERSQLCL